jgi:hypothetical protein
VYSDCERCAGIGTIRLETSNPNRWIIHWCPDCSRPPRVDPETGEWTQQPFYYQGQMTHEIESYAEHALLHGGELYWPRSGLRVRERWWREQQRLRDTLWGWRKTRRTTHGKQGYARDGSGRLCDQVRSSMSRPRSRAR